MPDTEEADSKTGDVKGTKKLGISTLTYGLGLSAEYHWALRIFSIILPIGLLTVFRNDNKTYNRDWLVNQFTKPEAWLRGKFKQVTHSTDNTADPFKGLLTLVVASGFMVSIVNRIFVEIPAIVKGRRIANQAGEKYNAALAENAELKARLATYEKPASEPAQETSAQVVAGRAGQSSRVAQRPARYTEAAMQREAAPPVQNL